MAIRGLRGVIAGSAIKTMGLGDLDKMMDWLVDSSVSGDIRIDAAYGCVPYVYRCTALRAQALSSLPFTIERNGKTVENWDGETMLRQALYLAEAGLCLTGQAYFYKRINAALILQGLQWFASSTITIEKDAEKGLLGFTRKVGAVSKLYKPEQLLYFWRVNPLGEIGPGPCEGDLALIEAGVQKNTFDWASAFFRRGAIPAVILGVEGNPGPEELQRLESWWKGLLQGVKRSWEAVAVRASVKPVVIGAPVKDLAMPDLDQITRRHICTAYGIHLSMIEEAANFATKKEDRLSFYEDTMLPEADMIARPVNAQLLAPMGLTLKFTPETMDIMQEDEAAKAVSLGQLVTAGLDLVTAMEILGYDLTPEQWERVKADIERKQQQGAALREAVAEAKPDEDGGNGAPDEQAQGQAPELQRKPAAPKALLTDLRLWRDKAKKRGKMCDFESEAIPAGIAESIKSLGFDCLKQMDEAAFRAEEEKLRREIVRVLRAQWEIAAAAITAGSSWDAAVFAKALQDAVDDVLVKIVLNQSLREAVSIGIDFDPAVINHAAWEWARGYSQQLVSGLTDTTRGVVQDAVSKFVATPGMTNADLRSLLEPAFGEVRAAMIGTTEVTRAFAEGTNAYRDVLNGMGMDMERVWRTSGDEVVCEICEPFNGKPENENGMWHSDVTGEDYDGPPAHPQDRCWMTLRMRRKAAT